MAYDILATYDVEDDYNGETIISHVREDKVFDTWGEVMEYRDALCSCPWISNVSVIDKRLATISEIRIGL